MRLLTMVKATCAPIACASSLLLCMITSKTKRRRWKRKNFNPLPEPLDLDQCVSFRPYKQTESLNKAKAQKESRILGHPANQRKGLNLYDLARNTAEPILGMEPRSQGPSQLDWRVKQMEGASITDALGFYAPVQLEFQCHPNWFEDGTGEAVFEVRINYRDGIKSGHAIRMVGSTSNQTSHKQFTERRTITDLVPNFEENIVGKVLMTQPWLLVEVGPWPTRKRQ